MTTATPERPEHAALLACAAAANSSASRQQLKSLTANGLDWKYLLEIAELHGMLPVLRLELEQVAPVPVHLAASCIRNATRSLAVTGELVAVLGLLESHGIAAVPFKGPALAQQLFGEVTMRQYHDLDILIGAHQVSEARRILMERGYEPDIVLSPSQEAEYVRSEHAFQLRKGQFVIELHWRFGARNQCFPLSAEDVWSDLRTARLMNRTVMALAPEQLLVYLAMHGAKHGWERLEWICSLAKLVASPDLNWNAIEDFCRARGALRALHLSLLLASSVCASPVPDHLMESARNDNAAVRLAEGARSRLFAARVSRKAEEITRQRYYLSSRERFSDRIRIVWFSSARIPHPLARDWELFPLPPKMSFLYYLLRPLRICREYGLRLIQG